MAGQTLTSTSVPEQRVCELLAPLLRSREVGDSIAPSSDDGYIFSAFEFFLPGVLREIHAEWRHESLDGIYPASFRKTGDREIELIGLALFISDQTLTPLHVRLQLSPDFDCVSWIDLKLGERIDGECRREPYGSAKASGTMLHVSNRLDSIDWYYHVGYGEQRS
ncbi:hypothetical protein RBSWK_04675 [Rhodopirellula baltica SWK14]|uniref:Uncharacterized protein n=1 Tax=Rhodopirellula baltica SWK14 TaxID=993516 RepID=L7CC42_RHOBT|nr:hypothetical protein RBSWK_04675 [Rhodopirellula baltica SWK14]